MIRLIRQQQLFAANPAQSAGPGTHWLAGLLVSGVLLLSACGGGGGGTSLAADDESPDPAVLDVPIAYITRPLPLPEDDQQINDISNPVEIFPGARLVIRDRSATSAEEVDITDQIIAILAEDEGVEPELLAVDIKDLEVSFDGQTLIFAVRGIPDIENNDEPELHTWNLWTYSLETQELGFLISSRLIRNEGANTGGGQDVAPHFLSDDRIVFSSTRQSAIQEKQLNEGRGQRYSAVTEDNDDVQAMALHIYDPESEEISQISINRSIDLDPATLDSGEIIFSRRNSNGQIGLYLINPSGAQVSELYGNNSGNLLSAEESTEGNNDRLHFLQPREMPDGRVLAFIRAEQQNHLGGDIALIDTSGFVELFTTVDGYDGGESRAQVALSDVEINALDELSPGGKFMAAYPLDDGSDRVLISWSSCRVENGDGLVIPCSIADEDDEVNGALQAAAPLFGLWIYNPNDQTQLPVVLGVDGMAVSEVVAAEPRSFPDFPDEEGVIDPVLANENQGLLIIDSVYNEDGNLINFAGGIDIASYAEPGTAAYQNRPARFVRVIQPVPLPNDDVLEDRPGNGGRYGELEILGYIPVEPDGSVTAKVPANTPLMINVLDADGRRISRRHEHWIQVARGEIVRCVGCHNPNSDVPHGRLDSLPPSLNPGATILSSGLEGYPGADPTLIPLALGDTMAETYNARRPETDTSLTVRDIQLDISYTDEWTDTATLTPDAPIDLDYDPAWDLLNAIISPNLDPALQGRIVINYDDHIQPIWERERLIEIGGNPVLNQSGIAVTNCVGCHTSEGGTVVPPGQLELTNAVVGNNGIFTTSYLELTRGDNEQWLDDGMAVADRQRICTETDIDGNILQELILFPVGASINRGSANASNSFFNCFEVDDSPNCGAFVQDLAPPPANCSDDGGTVNQDGPLTTKVVPDTFAEAQALMAALPTPADLTVDPELMFLLNDNCESCHSTGGGQVPHSDNDPDIAYPALRPYINLVNPGASTFVFRLATLNHQCGDTAACDALAVQMEQAISNFAAAVPEEEINNVIPGGSVAVQGTFNHYQLLTPSELRLISEWIDIGTPFFNNPFDPRLYD